MKQGKQAKRGQLAGSMHKKIENVVQLRYNCITNTKNEVNAMAKEATLQVRMDSELKEQVELLYKQMGTSFAEAVRIFARQSVEDRAMPFIMHLSLPKPERTLGIANGKYEIPDDIDECNHEIAEMFGVK